jgi:hypothetical protein
MANSVKLDFLAQGEMINDVPVIFEPTITGNFTDSTEFDESRNVASAADESVKSPTHDFYKIIKIYKIEVIL